MSLATREEKPGAENPRPRRVAPAYRIVAIPAALALGSVGGIAAEHANFPWILGAVAGGTAAALGVLALPSIPTRRATVVLLGLGGLAALRHASFAGADRSWLLVVWAVATMLTLVLVDRADAETVPALPGGSELPNRLGETARIGGIIAVVVLVAAVALVPTVTARLGRHVWPGLDPSSGDKSLAASSLKSSDQLDLTSRPRLSNSVVFTVDASRPDFWRGETFDTYNSGGNDGSATSSWTNSGPNDTRVDLQRLGTTVDVAPDLYDVGARSGVDFRQTFHIQAVYSDVVFAAPSARVIETDKPLTGRADGTVASDPSYSTGFGKGAVYTVTSRRLPVTEASLRAADATRTPDGVLDQYAEEPTDTTQRVRDLALQITRAAPTRYDKVKALESWMGENTRYSLNAPFSPAGVDVVDDFLFNTHLGWCEQIASSLVILARSAGIPARLVTGFAPERGDGLTGRFVVRENDAHAWAEIYFAGIGWQGFDPTASVPLAGDAKSGGSWLSDARRNAIPLSIALGLLIVAAIAAPEIVAYRRRRRARRASWSAATMHRLERVGRKAGRARAPAETPREYARALAERLGDDRLAAVGDTLDRDLYSPRGVPESDRAEADVVLTSL